MKKINQRGFAIVEGLLILIIITIIGFVVWFVWRANHAEQQTDNSSITAKSHKKTEPDSTFVDGPKAGWKTYTNNKYGFSIEVPKEFLSGNGGYCTKEDDSYRPKSAMVPTAIVEDGDNFYITESYTYQVTGGHEVADGTTSFSGCKKVEASADTIKQHKESIGSLEDDFISLAVMPITVTNAKDMAEATKKTKQILGENVIVTGFKNNKTGKWQDVEVTCDRDQELCLNFGFQLRYYETQHKLVYIEQGQDYKFFQANGNDSYDIQVTNSFKLLD